MTPHPLTGWMIAFRLSIVLWSIIGAVGLVMVAK
jgi:hypothetical protein